MSDLTAVSLRRFTQKMAGQHKSALNIMETLKHPQTLGTLGGAALGGLGGLGLYGVSQLFQSENARKRRGNITPALAGILGALVGGGAGYLGTGSSPVSKALRSRGYLQQSISGSDDEEPQYVTYGDVAEPNKALATAEKMPVTPPKVVGSAPSGSNP